MVYGRHSFRSPPQHLMPAGRPASPHLDLPIGEHSRAFSTAWPGPSVLESIERDSYPCVNSGSPTGLSNVAKASMSPVTVSTSAASGSARLAPEGYVAHSFSASECPYAGPCSSGHIVRYTSRGNYGLGFGVAVGRWSEGAETSRRGATLKGIGHRMISLAEIV